MDEYKKSVFDLTLTTLADQAHAAERELRENNYTGVQYCLNNIERLFKICQQYTNEINR